MALLQLIFLGLALYFAWLAIKLIIRIIGIFTVFKKLKNNHFNNFNQPQQTKKNTETKKMLQCKTCKLYIQEDTAIIKNSNVYCCKEHAE